MTLFVPHDIPSENWLPLMPKRPYAVRCGPEETIFFRFGQSHGIYFSLSPGSGVRLANTIDYETGDTALVGKLSDDSKVFLGRTSDCGIKIMHAIVSRQHLELQLKNTIVLVTDLASTNGTFLYGQAAHFDVDTYVAEHPPEKAHESTMDAIHEAFGPTLDDFLMSYLAERNKNV